MEVQADRASGSSGADELSSSGHALRSCDVELASDGVWRCVLPAYPEFLLEPLHSFWTLESPNNLDALGHCFAVSHSFNEIQQLANYGSNTAAASNEDDMVKSFDAPLHASVRAV